MYLTNEQIKHRKWHIDESRKAAGMEPMYSRHEKESPPPKPRKRRAK